MRYDIICFVQAPSPPGPLAAALLRRFLVSAAMILLFFLRSRMISLPRRWTLSGDGPGCSSTSRCWPHRVSCSCPYPVAFRQRSFQDADRPWRQMPLDYDIMHNIMLIPSDIDFTTHFAVQFPKSFKILYWFILRTGTASQATPRGRRLYRAGVGFEPAIKRLPARCLDQWATSSLTNISLLLLGLLALI